MEVRGCRALLRFGAEDARLVAVLKGWWARVLRLGIAWGRGRTLVTGMTLVENAVQQLVTDGEAEDCEINKDI